MKNLTKGGKLETHVQAKMGEGDHQEGILPNL